MNITGLNDGLPGVGFDPTDKMFALFLPLVIAIYDVCLAERMIPAINLKLMHTAELNVFVLKGAVPDVPLTTIFRGIWPFLIAVVFSIIILTLFPQIAAFVPSHM